MLIACAGAWTAQAESAGENPVEIFIDFEGLPEFTPIGIQYADLGVTFELAGSVALPIIATEGAPVTAFSGYDGSLDTPFVSGVSGLTDPPGASVIDSSDMVIRFAKPVRVVRLWVIDIDGGHGENWTDRCTVSAADDKNLVIDMMTLDANDPGTGDLSHSRFEVVAPEGSTGIVKVVIDVSENMGYAIDDLSFILMPPGGGPDDGPEPPAGGGGGTPGVIHVINPIGQETLDHIFVFGRSFITSEPDGGETYAVVPYEDGAFDVDANLLPCGIPVYWSLIGIGPRGNIVRIGSKLHPIIRRPFGDLTIDGSVDAADLSLLIQAFLESEAIGDLNNDGLVDTADLGLLIRAFGSTCHD